jgi:diphthamide biosynthesis protein 7
MGIDWTGSSAGATRATPRVALSSTAGKLFVCEAAPAGLAPLLDWQAHELEGWAVAFDAHEPSLLFSGADDATLKRWDLRCAVDGAAPAAVATNRRSHQAGVCCISPCARRPLVATGSYDETTRLWDLRQMRAPVHELGCGGGVWRLKWHPARPELLLAACMHAGFKVLALDDAGAPHELASYTAHGVGKALAYGADWERSTRDGEAGALRAATCSFYDKALHLWQLDLDAPLQEAAPASAEAAA